VLERPVLVTAALLTDIEITLVAMKEADHVHSGQVDSTLALVARRIIVIIGYVLPVEDHRQSMSVWAEARSRLQYIAPYLIFDVLLILRDVRLPTYCLRVCRLHDGGRANELDRSHALLFRDLCLLGRHFWSFNLDFCFLCGAECISSDKG